MSWCASAAAHMHAHARPCVRVYVHALTRSCCVRPYMHSCPVIHECVCVRACALVLCMTVGPRDRSVCLLLFFGTLRLCVPWPSMCLCVCTPDSRAYMCVCFVCTVPPAPCWWCSTVAQLCAAAFRTCLHHQPAPLTLHVVVDGKQSRPASQLAPSALTSGHSLSSLV